MVPPRIELPFNYVHQQTMEDCWKAVAVMQLERVGVNVDEVGVGRMMDGRNVDHAAGSPEIGELYKLFGQPVRWEQNWISLPAMFGELADGFPVQVGYLWTSGGGHTALVVGYEPDGRLIVADPYYGVQLCAWPAVMTAYGGGSLRYIFELREVGEG